MTQKTKSKSASSKNAKSSSTKSHAARNTGVAIAAAAVAAAAVGAYFFTGKRGAKNRAVVKGWAVKAKGEVLERIENLKHVDAETYARIVDDVTRRYKAMKKDPAEVLALAKELKGYWGEISKTKKQKSNLPPLGGNAGLGRGDLRFLF